MLCSAFGHLVRETLSLVNSFESFSFSHSYRQGNIVAHVLTKKVRFLFIYILKKEKEKEKEKRGLLSGQSLYIYYAIGFVYHG